MDTNKIIFEASVTKSLDKGEIVKSLLSKYNEGKLKGKKITFVNPTTGKEEIMDVHDLLTLIFERSLARAKKEEELRIIDRNFALYAAAKSLREQEDGKSNDLTNMFENMGKQTIDQDNLLKKQTEEQKLFAVISGALQGIMPQTVPQMFNNYPQQFPQQVNNYPQQFPQMFNNYPQQFSQQVNYPQQFPQQFPPQQFQQGFQGMPQQGSGSPRGNIPEGALPKYSEVAKENEQ